MEDNQSYSDLQVDEQAGTQLSETSRWARFLGVACLIGLGIVIVLLAVAFSRIEELMAYFVARPDMDGGSVRVFKIALAFALFIVTLITIVLTLFLIRGANAIRTGLRQRDQALFNTGLGHLRNYFAMMAVLGIIALLFSLMTFFRG